MQTDDEKNYWENESDSKEISETYAPEQIEEDTLGDDSGADKAEDEVDSDTEPIHWSANEYIHEEKNVLWFSIFSVVVILLIAVDILLLKSYTFSLLVVVMAVAVVIYSRRPPREIDYTLSGNQGLYVGERLYHFSEFKAFGLIKDRGQHSIMLIPIKRFSPSVTVYFPEQAGEKIVDTLGARLPMEDLKLDFIDVIVRKLRL